MDIRYIDYSNHYSRGLYLCETDTHWCFVHDGKMGEVCEVIFTDGHKKIPAPDALEIEDRYLNATDRPSREGFKHPDVVEPWI